MTTYALFLGCTIPARQPNYELSARKSLNKLGVTLVDLANMTCCAPPPVQSIDLETSLSMAAYNLALAEEANLNIITLCTGCFESLAMTNTLLKKDSKLRTKVNKNLSPIGKEFKGTQEVRHYLQVLIQDIGLDSIQQQVVKPLTELKIATFYGCHILRPSELLRFDDPERPRIFEDLVEILGAKSIDYRNKLKCCGGLLRGYSDDLALSIAREKISNAKQAGADCIATLCPFCFMSLDMGQLMIRSKFQETYDLPILHYSELLSLAIGINNQQLSPHVHKIKIDSIINKIG